jgi:hypothetical protein
MVQFVPIRQHMGCVMKGILFFVVLMCSFTVRSEVFPEASGWYSLEREGDAVTQLFSERTQSCLTLSESSMVVRIYAESDDKALSASATGSVTILLYGREDADKGQNAPFGYRNTGALLVPTIAMNDTWFCAELRHAYAHLIRNIGVEGMEDPVTEEQLFALEEISVREEMRSYLTNETSGRYASALDSALKQKESSSTEKQIQMLNTVFPPAQSTEELAIRNEQFLFDLKVGGLMRVSEKVSTYISLMQPPQPSE